MYKESKICKEYSHNFMKCLKINKNKQICNQFMGLYLKYCLDKKISFNKT